MFNHLKIDLQTLLDDGISRDDAIELVINSVETSKPKRRQTINEAVNIAASYTVSQAFSEHRRTICRRAEKIERDRAKSTEKLQAKVAGLMRFRLPSGTAIADATGADCADAASFYMTNAKVYYHRAEFLRQIADRVGESKVSDVLGEADLQLVYENAKRLP